MSLSKPTIKKFIIALVINIFHITVSAQPLTENIKKNSLYIEFLGSSPLLYNLTYDRLFVSKSKINFSAALGIQYVFDREIDGVLNSDFTVTPQFNMLFGRKHFFELGIGAAFPFGDGETLIPCRLGYRFQKENGGLFIKAAYTPIYFLGGEYFGRLFKPWGGLSLGYTF